jgi:hypothetical protein
MKSERWIGKDLEETVRELNLDTISVFVWKDWKKSTKTLRQDNRSPGKDLNPVSHQYEAKSTNHSNTTLSG